MNYLAHVYLSCHDDDLLIGNFIADFLTTKEVQLQPPAIKRGIDLHKSIDSFTDQHPEVKACIVILRPTQGKYSPVIADILFDYFLTRNWHTYSDIELELFSSTVYKILEENCDTFPSKLRTMLPHMIEDDFLLSCKNETRLIKTFERLKKRVKFDNHFDTIISDLKKHHDELNLHFLAFFPDLIKHVNIFCNC